MPIGCSVAPTRVVLWDLRFRVRLVQTTTDPYTIAAVFTSGSTSLVPRQEPDDVILGVGSLGHPDPVPGLAPFRDELLDESPTDRVLHLIYRIAMAHNRHHPASDLDLVSKNPTTIDSVWAGETNTNDSYMAQTVLCLIMKFLRASVCQE